MQKHAVNYLKATGKQPHEITCELCGTAAVEIHHIESRRYKNSDNIDNLIALCRECHIQAHNNNSYENKQKLLKIAKERHVL